MSSHDPDVHPPGSSEDPRSESDHPEAGKDPRSFVQRLRTHFGEDADPEINLQAPEESVDSGGALDDGSRTPDSSRELVERLGNQILLGPRYEVRDELARGGMGTILRIWDDDLRRNLAMKVMHGRGRTDSEESEADQERLGRFLEEAQITSQLDHPGIVPVHDLGIDDDGRCYFTMRLVRGTELKEALDAAREGKEGMTRTKVLGVILKVCEAMAYAHSKGVVHRDLKPSNIMVGRFGETYVMDWGLARVIGRRDSHDIRLKPSPNEITALSLVKTVRRDESDANPDSPLVTMDGDVVGTPCYMAPEQAQGKLEEVGPHSDVYSLGAILYYLLSGHVPYVGEGERVSPHTVLTRVLQGSPTPLSKLAKDQPEELIAICEKAMQRDPERRYRSMLEVAEDIEAFLENRVVKAYEVGSIAEFRKWVQRNRGMAATLACMLLGSVAVVIFFFLQKESQVEKLENEKMLTAEAKDKADANARRALENERLAKENEKEALAQREEADRSAALALRKSREAQRSEYVANLLAADYSLQLNDVQEARSRLETCDSALRGWEWEHLSLKSDAAIRHNRRFTGGVEELVYDPLTRRLVLLLPSSEVKFFDLEKEKVLKHPRVNLSLTRLAILTKTDMSVSVLSRKLALVSRDPIVRVHDLDTGEKLYELPARSGEIQHDARATVVSFSPDGQVLASGAEDGSIILWDTEERSATYQLAGHRTRVTSLSWNPEGTRLASSASDGTVFVWDPGIGMSMHSLSGHSGMPVNAIVWSREGKTIYTGGDDQTIGVWEAELGRRQRTLTGHTGPVRGLAYDPLHERIASGSDDGTVRVWAGDGSSQVLRSHLGAVRTLIFEPDGETILSCDVQGYLNALDPAGDLSQTELEPAHGTHDIEAVAFSPDGRVFVTAGKDHHLVLWAAGSGEPRRRLRGHTNLVNDVCFSPNGRYVLSGSHDKTARLWDARTGRALRVYPAGEKYVKSVGITRDGLYVITGAGDRKIRIYDLETSELLHELTPSVRTQLNRICISPDGRHIAADDSIWDLQNLEAGKPRATVRGIVKNVRSVAFSPDGERLVVGRGTGVLENWDLTPILGSAGYEAQGRLLYATKDHGSWISAVSFTPDGERIISSSADGTMRIRSVESGETLLVLRDPSDHVEGIAFSPDGKRLLAAGEKGALRIWEGGGPNARRTRRDDRLAYRRRLDEAGPLVDSLFLDHFLLSEVMLRIPQAAGVSSSVRDTALRLAQMRGDDPELLNSASLADALPSRNEAYYPRALRRSEAAAELTRENPDHRVELVAGISRYRNGRYAEAVEALMKASDLNRSARTRFSPREEAWRYLFLSMAYQGQERHVDAKSTFEQFRRWLDDQEDFELGAELQDLVVEVEELLSSSG